MPFGISSAPEVLQRKMHETIERLDGTEVIADDFLIIGKDDAEHDANSSTDVLKETWFSTRKSTLQAT